MSTALVSAFYDINDVIQQNDHRPTSLNLHNNLNLAQRRNESLLLRRHSTNSGNTQKVFNASSFFNNMPSSPKTTQDNYNKLFAYQNAKERSLSVGGLEESDGQQRKQRVSTNSSRYKTELCRPYEENGTCKYGDKCQFAHGSHELRSLNRHPKYKTELCRTFHTIGFCPYGPRCHFVHKAEEIEKPSSDSRSGSVSSLGSTPPSPTPSLESLQSPFVNIPTPNTTSVHDNVFVFGDDPAAPISPPSSESSGSTSPVESSFPISGSMSDCFPSKIHSSKPALMKEISLHPVSDVSLPVSIPSSPVMPNNMRKSPISPDSPPNSDEEFDAFGRRRLPIFNKLA